MPVRRAGTFSPPSIAFMTSGLSYYPIALLSNKLAHFVQFVKEKLTLPSPTEFLVTVRFLEPISLEK
jgi:hypothetical protein